MPSRTQINIRPDVTILSVLKHLNYTYWHALAEFVDNAIQSYLNNKEELRKIDKKKLPLRVAIKISPENQGLIIIRDNAAGIHQKDFKRAFKAASMPTTPGGLSEFGMGMKSASVWAANQWSVRTSPAGVPLEHTVAFNIPEIVEKNIEEVGVITSSAAAKDHFTEIRLEQLSQIPTEKTIIQIKKHLSSIYRVLLRSGELQLTVDGEALSYKTPEILVAPYYKTPTATPREWRKNIELAFGPGVRVSGFIAIRETASTYEAGLALIRHNRVVVGSAVDSADDSYRPSTIFGARTKAQNQRIFGELHLEGFRVSHTKDGIVWGHEVVEQEIFLSRLKDEITAESMPLLQQASNYSYKSKVKPGNGKDPKAPPPGNGKQPDPSGNPGGVGPGGGGKAPLGGPEPAPPPGPNKNPAVVMPKAMQFTIPTSSWLAKVRVGFIRDAGKDLLTADTPSPVADQSRALSLTLNLEHSLFSGEEQAAADEIRRISFLASALCVAELVVKDASAPSAAVRKYLNTYVKMAPWADSKKRGGKQ